MAAVAHSPTTLQRSLRRWTTSVVLSVTLLADMPSAADRRPRDPHIASDASAGGSLDAPGDAPADTDRLVAPDNARPPDRRHRAGPTSASAPGPARSPHREHAHSIIGL